MYYLTNVVMLFYLYESETLHVLHELRPLQQKCNRFPSLFLFLT